MTSIFTNTTNINDTFVNIIYSSEYVSHYQEIYNNKEIVIKCANLSAFYSSKQVLFDINLWIPKNSVSAVIGPSGCGKSTLLRCMNRMHEITPGGSIDGNIFLNDLDIMDPRVNPAAVRRKIGMVFQKPNPFPTMSIYKNVSSGIELASWRKPKNIDKRVEHALRQAALWDEVEDKLHEKGTHLSGGQQQRLCIARCLATEPDIILMDEPTSSLDPSATNKIEDLVLELKENYTVIIVTHNIAQAARIADYTAFLYLGKLIEVDRTEKLFENASNELTENFITGKFG